MKGQIRLPSDQSQNKSSRSNSIIKVLQLARIGGLIKLSLRQICCLFVIIKYWMERVLFLSMLLFRCAFLALTGALEVCPCVQSMYVFKLSKSLPRASLWGSSRKTSWFEREI